MGSGTAALIEYQYLVKKIVFKISTIPVVKVVSSLFVHLFFTMLPIIVYCCCGNAPHLYMLQLIYYMICLTVFLTALLYFTSSVALFFKMCIRDRTIIDALGKSRDLIQYVTDRPGHDMRYAIDPTKIHDELGWEPTTKFDDGIKKTIDWYLNNKPWWEKIISGEYQNYYEKMYAGR